LQVAASKPKACDSVGGVTSVENLADIYVRLSDEDRDKRSVTDESESIQNQKSMLINYCIEQGWQIHNIYCDEDYSGADRNRPAFNQMLQDCEDGKVNIVLCKTQSRFSRDMEIIEKYIHGKFLEWNIRFVSIVDHADTSVAGNKKARQINGLINEWYLEDLSDNIRKTLHHKKIKGEYCCPYAPYGYKLDPEDKHHFVVDPPAAEVVKSIFEMYRSGMGYVRIAKALNAKRIPPPGVYKAMQSINYRNVNAERASSKQWRDASIYYILHQEVYTGAIVQGKSKNLSYKNKKRVKLPKSQWIVVPNMHEPIIDEKLWSDVQNLIKNHQGNDKQFKGNGEINPLRGVVYCMECGSGMWRMSYQCADRRYKYYRCRTVKNSTGICDNVNSIRQVDLEALILKELKKLIDGYFDPNQITLHKGKSSKNKIDALEKEQHQIEKKIEKAQNDCVQLYKDKLNGVLGDAQFRFLSSTFNSEIDQCRERLKMIDEEISCLSCENTAKLSREEILAKYKDVDKLTFELVHELIGAVYVGKINPENNEREIEIHWKL
jgi:DNA invertase Pin-like site-specific DNA recombinase